MASSDDWIKSFDSMTIIPSPSSSQSQPSPGGSSLSGGTISGEYGGGAKRATLFYYVDSLAPLCLGFVGSGRKRFCLKPRADGAPSCGVAKHSVKFSPSSGSYYLRGVDSTAFCEPSLAQALVPEEYRGQIGLLAKTIGEWKDVFRSYLEQARDASNIQLMVNDGSKSLVLKTPKKDRASSSGFAEIIIPGELKAIVNQIDDLPLQSLWWEEDGLGEVLSMSLFSFLQDLRAFLVKYDQWLLQPHDVTAARMDMISEDLHQLRAFCEDLSSKMGRSMLIQDQEFPDIWCGIEFLTTWVLEKSPSTGVTELRNIINDLQTSIAEMNSLASTVATCESAIETHEGRFKFLHPILQAAHRCVSQLPLLSNRLDALETAFARGRHSNVAPQSTSPADPWAQSFAPTPDISPSSSSGSSSMPIPDGEARLNTLEHLVHSLEKRIVGDGIRMGRFLFQSKEDLRLWIIQHVKDNRFGLFLDAVSIFDFLAQAHIDSDTNMSHLYNSQKNGFDTTYESRIISSMQNLFPNLFGKSSSDGLDTSRALPGLQTPEKWNSEGVTGLQLQVERELPNVDLQFRNAIASTFEDNAEARDLALELLYRSKKFALDLCNFIQRDFEFWRHKKYTRKDAWELTSLSVRRIFEDIHVVRVVGRDSRDLRNPTLTATQVMWATLRAHTVMEEYSRRNFFEHPSISAVIARHLASNHTKPDATLEDRFRKFEERFDKLLRKVDGLESRLNNLDPKNVVTPPRKARGGGRIKGNKDQEDPLDE
jgi:hypothetical protein